MGINNDMSDILYVSNGTYTSSSTTPVNCEEEKAECKKNRKR